MAAMARPKSLSLSPDPFLVALIAVVGGASLLPVRGSAAGFAEGLASLGIALLFFLHGAKLSRAAIVQGAGNLKLHALVFASTYVLFPVLGLAVAMGLRGWFNPLLLSGLLYLTLLPSTVQSSIAFTAIARGNVAAAVCSASLSNLVGIILTPLLVSLLMHIGGQGTVSVWHSVRAIMLQLLVPFLAGHALRPVIGGVVDRHKTLVQRVDRGSILLVVYTAFSAAVVKGIWTMVHWSDLLVLLTVSAVILGLVMLANALLARIARLSREDFIVLLFCGSKKSLASGVPMAGALFPPAQVGLVVLPLMIFHQLQLFVCAILAGRFRQQTELLEASEATRPGAGTLSIPGSEGEIAEAAAALGMTVPDACMPGVAANLTTLRRHAGLFLQPGALDSAPGS